MRSPSHARTVRTGSSFPWTWVIVIGIIIIVFFINVFFWGKTENISGKNSLKVLPWSGSEVYIKPASGQSTQVSWVENLYTTDSSLSVANGFAQVSSTLLDGYLDKSSEMAYMEHTSDGEKLDLVRGRIWIESHGNTTLQMKNLDATIKNGDIVMAEQPNQIFSTLYVLKGNITLIAWGNSYTLSAGKKIMISKSDLANAGTTLDALTWPIDDSIRQNPLFILRNGGTLLWSLGHTSWWTGTLSNPSLALNGSISSGSLLINSPTTKYIEVTLPLDQTIINTPTVDISGRLLSKDIKRVTLNDLDAVLSPVNESFSFKWFPVNGNILNIVYKAYSRDTALLERGVITIYPKNRQAGTDKLTPTNFPVNDKAYTIFSPSENPYITTDSAITVKWTVPKNTVQYVMVNHFRLKKFVPYSSSWYYYANTDSDTLKEWINLYEINFYGANDELIYKRLFTIVKEKQISLSWEVIQ